jgi:hypothetical protein
MREGHSSSKLNLADKELVVKRHRLLTNGIRHGQTERRVLAKVKC